MAVALTTEYQQFPTVLCFRHCEEGSNVSCFEIPSGCPCCGRSLKSANFLVPPFAVPTPFSFTDDGCQSSDISPCSLLIKPTTGNFLT
eukprot:gene7176-12842_t